MIQLNDKFFSVPFFVINYIIMLNKKQYNFVGIFTLNTKYFNIECKFHLPFHIRSEFI